MGLFSFIKDAGIKIFGQRKAEVSVSSKSQVVEREDETLAAGKLEALIVDLKLEVDNLNVEIKDDMATVSGTVHDQSTKEKVVLVIGNTEGISTVDDQMTVIHEKPESQFYKVIKGDTLGKVAKRFYGNAMKYPIIFEANKPMLSNPDKIYPGQILRIPHLN